MALASSLVTGLQKEDMKQTSNYTQLTQHVCEAGLYEPQAAETAGDSEDMTLNSFLYVAFTNTYNPINSFSTTWKHPGLEKGRP